jgi:hypothetical protein
MVTMPFPFGAAAIRSSSGRISPAGISNQIFNGRSGSRPRVRAVPSAEAGTARLPGLYSTGISLLMRDRSTPWRLRTTLAVT